MVKVGLQRDPGRATLVLLVTLTGCLWQRPAPPLTPAGARWARAGRRHEVTVGPDSAVPAPGGPLSYRVDWGDSVSNWSAYVSGRSAVAFSHVWACAGKYPVRAMLSDAEGRSSVWSEPLAVSVLTDPGFPYVVTDSFAIGHALGDIATSPDGTTAYVFDHEAGAIRAFDTRSGRVTSVLPLEPGLVRALPDGRHILTLGHSLRLISVPDLVVIDSVDITAGEQLTVSPDGTLAFVTLCGCMGRTDVFRLPDLERVGSIPGEWLAVAAPDGCPNVYLTDYEGGCIGVARTSDFAVVARLAVPYPLCAAAAPDGRHVFVAGEDRDGYIVVVRTADNQVVGRIACGGEPYWLAPLPNGEFLYVDGDDGIIVVDLAAGAVVDTLAANADAVAPLPDCDRVYATSGDIYLRVLGLPDSL